MPREREIGLGDPLAGVRVAVQDLFERAVPRPRLVAGATAVASADG
ncbi:hypothetical protein [Streptomyces pinistramenti]|nr:hypothetical protein [Streptomyces pinistramenti]MCB5910084.1 hypothetical protein [Streptomyces pinistramenti]